MTSVTKFFRCLFPVALLLAEVVQAQETSERYTPSALLSRLLGDAHKKSTEALSTFLFKVEPLADLGPDNVKDKVANLKQAVSLFDKNGPIKNLLDQKIATRNEIVLKKLGFTTGSWLPDRSTSWFTGLRLLGQIKNLFVSDEPVPQKDILLLSAALSKFQEEDKNKSASDKFTNNISWFKSFLIDEVLEQIKKTVPVDGKAPAEKSIDDVRNALIENLSKFVEPSAKKKDDFVRIIGGEKAFDLTQQFATHIKELLEKKTESSAIIEQLEQQQKEDPTISVIAESFGEISTLLASIEDIQLKLEPSADLNIRKEFLDSYKNIYNQVVAALESRMASLEQAAVFFKLTAPNVNKFEKIIVSGLESLTEITLIPPCANLSPEKVDRLLEKYKYEKFDPFVVQSKNKQKELIKEILSANLKEPSLTAISESDKNVNIEPLIDQIFDFSTFSQGDKKEKKKKFNDLIDAASKLYHAQVSKEQKTNIDLLQTEFNTLLKSANVNSDRSSPIRNAWNSVENAKEKFNAAQREFENQKNLADFSLTKSTKEQVDGFNALVTAADEYFKQLSIYALADLKNAKELEEILSTLNPTKEQIEAAEKILKSNMSRPEENPHKWRKRIIIFLIVISVIAVACGVFILWFRKKSNSTPDFKA